MFALTKQEKTILIFLTVTFVAGLGMNVYKKSQKTLELSVQPYEIEALREKADNFIARNSLVDINSFKIDELIRLSGVGKKLAKRIVEYHNIHGPFKTKEELMQVKGIGKKKFEQMKDFIILSPER